MKKALSLLLALFAVSFVFVSAFPASAEYVPTSLNTVPKEYVPVEYLESNGTQIIDSGLLPKANSRVEVRFCVTDSTKIGGKGSAAAAGIVGTNMNGSVSRACIQIAYKHADAVYTIRVGANVMNNTTVPKDEMVDHTVITDAVAGTITFDGTVIQSSTDGSGYVEEEDRPTFGIFGIRMAKNSTVMTSSTRNCAGNGYERIYYVKFWEGDTLVGEFVPVYRTADKVGGMYDLVTEKFFTNVFNTGSTEEPVFTNFAFPGSEEATTSAVTTAAVTTAAATTAVSPVTTAPEVTTAAATTAAATTAAATTAAATTAAATTAAATTAAEVTTAGTTAAAATTDNATTAAVTEQEPQTAHTTAPEATDAPETKPAEKSGCGSVASVGIAAVVAILGTALLGRKENE